MKGRMPDDWRERIATYTRTKSANGPLTFVRLLLHAIKRARISAIIQLMRADTVTDLLPADADERNSTPLAYACNHAALPTLTTMLKSAHDRQQAELLTASAALRRFGARPFSREAREEMAATIDDALNAGVPLPPLARHLLRSIDGGARSSSATDRLLLALLLCSAAVTCDERAAATLLSAGVSAHARDADGRTALALAAEAGALPIVHALLAAGASPNAHDSPSPAPASPSSEPRGPPTSGGSALCAACASGRLSCVDALIAAKADVNLAERAACQPTPLMLACAAGASRCAKALLLHSADVQLEIVEPARCLTP